MSEPLQLEDRVACAAAQVRMEMEGGSRLMTVQRLGEIAGGWGDGDAGLVVTGVWDGLLESTEH